MDAGEWAGRGSQAAQRPVPDDHGAGLQGQPGTTAALIADNGFGGLFTEQYLVPASGYYGENGLYWLEEGHRLALAEGMTPECPFFLHFVGTSAKMQSYAVARAAIEDVWTQTIAQVTAVYGAAPRPVLVQTGGDVNTASDIYHQVQAQYDAAIARNALIATHQRIWPISDANIHPDARTRVLIGELVGIALRETEAGNAWTVTATVTKSGATVTVAFSLRPGETLVNRAGLYADFGGDAATAANYGFEADGGIAGVTIGAASVTITLNSASATWLRFARQKQDVSSLTDGAGVTMSAHRTTLFASHSWPSQMYPGETLHRSLPSFEGAFSGNTFTFGPVA